MKNSSILLMLLFSFILLNAQYFDDGSFDNDAHRLEKYKSTYKWSGSQIQFSNIKKTKYLKDVNASNIFSVFSYLTNVGTINTDYTLFLYKYADTLEKKLMGDKSFIQLDYKHSQNNIFDNWHTNFYNQIINIYGNNILFVNSEDNIQKYYFPYKNEYVQYDINKDDKSIRIYYSTSDELDWASFDFFQEEFALSK